LLRRLLIALTVTASLSGCLETRNEKIYVRRVPPTREELKTLQPPPYEEILRREDAEQQRLIVPMDVHDETNYLHRGHDAFAAATAAPHDPWEAAEADRIRVLQSKNWADVGSSPPPEVFPRSEPPVEQDPFAPVPKSGKKKEEAGEGAAPAEGGDKPAEKPAGEMGGDKMEPKNN
jgi:hypothetical protein